MYPGNEEKQALARKIMQKKSRDNARTPVQWTSEPHAGFTAPNSKPWMRVNDNYPEINVADQQKDPNSVLNYWKKINKLRKQYSDLTVFGDFEVWDFLEPDSFTFTKENKANGLGNKKLLVFLSFSDEEQPLHFPPDCKGKEMELLIANVDQPGQYLSPWEARVYLVSL